MVCDADPAPHSVDTPKEGEGGEEDFSTLIMKISCLEKKIISHLNFFVLTLGYITTIKHHFT